MIALNSCRRPWSRASAIVALLGLGIGLAGCANLGDSMVSGAFVDPAKYDYYDCKLLETERAALTARAKDLQGLMDKASTGVAGSVVGEVAYRNDYISVRAQNKLADEAWRRNKCHETTPGAAPATPAAAPAPPPANAKGGHQPSGSAIY